MPDIDEIVLGYPGAARQVWGGWVWVTPGETEQRWSKAATQAACHAKVVDVVERLGVAAAFDLPDPAKQVQRLLDGWQRADVAARATADEFADEFFSVETFDDDISTDLIYEMARAHWDDCRSDFAWGGPRDLDLWLVTNGEVTEGDFLTEWDGVESVLVAATSAKNALALANKYDANKLQVGNLPFWTGHTIACVYYRDPETGRYA